MNGFGIGLNRLSVDFGIGRLEVELELWAVHGADKFPAIPIRVAQLEVASAAMMNTINLQLNVGL